MKIISIVGTRPQFIKLCMVDKKFKELNIDHIVINTGQHYDKNMSDDLFNILEIKDIKYNLIKKGETNTQFLGNTMIEIENILKLESPNKVIVYGDCDTTLAGAIVSNKLEIQLIHIESGMRSFNKNMPEEINRIIVDNLSDILLCSTYDSIYNLKKENITNNVFFIGNIHIELLEFCKNKINTKKLNEKFVLLTIHRKSNTTPIMINKIFNLLKEINLKIKFLLHPRTKNIINQNNIFIPKNIEIMEPQNYLEMINLIKNSEYVITDSGGLQYECFYLSKKCIILREETEWLEPIKYNNNILYNWEEDINMFINSFLNKDTLEFNFETNVTDNIIKYII